MSTTLNALVAKYLRSGRPAPGTRKEYRTTLRKWASGGGGVPIEELGRTEIREFLDWVVGGPGLKRGRRHPKDIRVGDQVDSWEVLGVEPERRLTLAFGMRAPGSIRAALRKHKRT